MVDTAASTVVATAVASATVPIMRPSNSRLVSTPMSVRVVIRRNIQVWHIISSSTNNIRTVVTTQQPRDRQ